MSASLHDPDASDRPSPDMPASQGEPASLLPEAASVAARPVDRRGFLRGVAGGVVLGTAAPAVLAAGSGSGSGSGGGAGPKTKPHKHDHDHDHAEDRVGRRSGFIVRETDPQCLETPGWMLEGDTIPTHRFFVRSHFAVPKMPPAGEHRVEVTGHVERPVRLGLDELKRLGPVARRLMFECAGNGRVFLRKARGLQWEHGAVGSADWTGVPLAAVLDHAGVKPDAVDVVLEGADSGAINDPAAPPGAISFARSLPVGKARRPEVVLAWDMNGEPLTAAHGAPIRAVVGGWYGMAGVKWLTRIVVLDRPFHGHWQTNDYAVWRRIPGGAPTLVPIGPMQVKSIITRPRAFERLPAGKPVIVTGLAWTGDGTVTRVEFSGDGGRTWADAQFTSRPVEFTWRTWATEWTPAAGSHELLCRATDSQGRTQPATRDADLRTVMVTHPIPTTVEAVKE